MNNDAVKKSFKNITEAGAQATRSLSDSEFMKVAKKVTDLFNFILRVSKWLTKSWNLFVRKCTKHQVCFTLLIFLDVLKTRAEYIGREERIIQPDK